MNIVLAQSASGAVTLTLDGALDAAAADRLSISGQVAVDRAAGRPVRLDLARVTSVDPHAVDILAELDGYAAAAGSSFELVDAPRELSEVLRRDAGA